MTFSLREYLLLRVLILISALFSRLYTILTNCVEKLIKIQLLVLETLTSIISSIEFNLVGSTYNLSFASPNDDDNNDNNMGGTGGVPDLIPDDDDSDDSDDDDDDDSHLNDFCNDDDSDDSDDDSVSTQSALQNDKDTLARALGGDIEAEREIREKYDAFFDEESENETFSEGASQLDHYLDQELASVSSNNPRGPDDDDDDSNNNPEGGNPSSGGGGPGNTSGPSGENSSYSIIDKFLVGFLGILSYIGDIINTLPIGF